VTQEVSVTAGANRDLSVAIRSKSEP